MTVRSKAIIEAAKSVGIFLAALAGFYVLLGFLGPKFGILLLLASMILWFAWLSYDYYLNKFTTEEKFKN